MGDKAGDVPWKEQSMKDQIETLRQVTFDDLDSQKKKLKGWKLPFGLTAGGTGKLRKNKVLVCYLMRNKSIKFFWTKIMNGMVEVGDVVHNANPGFMFLYKRFSFLIIPAWSINPVSPVDYKDTTSAEQIIIRGIESKEAQIPKKLGGGSVIWIVIAVIVGAYLLFGGGA